MNQEIYAEKALLFKALSDTNRLMIVDMLSCGEMCACNILEKFNITQPTLSHHMKILSNCGLVCCRKDGRWMHYSLNELKIQEFKSFFHQVTTNGDDCVCKEKTTA